MVETCVYSPGVGVMVNDKHNGTLAMVDVVIELLPEFSKTRFSLYFQTPG
jgi:hypothetical protein